MRLKKLPLRDVIVQFVLSFTLLHIVLTHLGFHINKLKLMEVTVLLLYKYLTLHMTALDGCKNGVNKKKTFCLT